jgi:hypothetical protein
LFAEATPLVLAAVAPDDLISIGEPSPFRDPVGEFPTSGGGSFQVIPVSHGRYFRASFVGELQVALGVRERCEDRIRGRGNH